MGAGEAQHMTLTSLFSETLKVMVDSHFPHGAGMRLSRKRGQESSCAHSLHITGMEPRASHSGRANACQRAETEAQGRAGSHTRWLSSGPGTLSASSPPPPPPPPPPGHPLPPPPDSRIVKALMTSLTNTAQHPSPPKITCC